MLKVLKPKLFRAGLVSRLDLSQGRTCSGLDMSQGQTCPSNLGLDLSQGRTCPKTLGLEVSKSSRAGSVSRLKMSKSLGQDVSLGGTWFLAGLGSRLEVSWTLGANFSCNK